MEPAEGERAEKLWFRAKSMNSEPEDTGSSPPLGQRSQAPRLPETWLAPPLEGGRSPHSSSQVCSGGRRCGRARHSAESRCHVLWLERWVSVGPGQEMELKRDAGADLAASKAKAKRCAWQGSIPSKEQISNTTLGVGEEVRSRCRNSTGGSYEVPRERRNGMDRLRPGSRLILTGHLGRLPGGGSPEAVPAKSGGGGGPALAESSKEGGTSQSWAMPLEMPLPQPVRAPSPT